MKEVHCIEEFAENGSYSDSYSAGHRNTANSCLALLKLGEVGGNEEMKFLFFLFISNNRSKPN